MALSAASSATARSLVPAVTMRIAPRPVEAVGRPDAHGASHLVDHGIGEPGAQCLTSGGIGARDERAAATFQQALGDRDDLLGILPLAVDDLGVTVPQGAVVVDRGEVERLERRHR